MVEPSGEDYGDTIFGKILRREIPTEVVHEDIHCLAFKDVNPVAPQHILIIPKRPIPMLAKAGEEDRTLLGHLLFTAAEIARSEGFEEDGYRVVINNGERANQTVFHLHLHLMAGRDFTWPPG